MSSNSNSSSSNSSSICHPLRKRLRLFFSLCLALLALSLQVFFGAVLSNSATATTTSSAAFMQRAEEGMLLSDLLSSVAAAAATWSSSSSLLNATTTTATTTSSASSSTSSQSSQATLSAAGSTTASDENSNVVPSVFHQEEQPFKDALCVGCREQMVKTGKHARQSCGSLIYKQLQQQHGDKKDLVLATQLVMEHFQPENLTQSDECHLCRPHACLDPNDKHYYRPDLIAPRVVHAKTLYLPGIPAQHRVPHPQFVNWTVYFSNSSHVHPHRTYYFEYNPSIVQIPKSQIPATVLSADQAAETVYLASFRVTNTQQCVTGDDELMMIGGQWPRPPSQDYLGLALLRHDFSIIVDVVLDNQKRHNKKNQENHALHGMEDYRLFVLKEQIYVASFNKIVPLWLVAPTINNEDVVLVENKFPSALTVHSRTFASCAASDGGKNINYFVDDHSKNNVTVVAELFPMSGKRAVHLDQPCPASEHLHHNETLPLRKSFGSYEEIHFFNHGAFSTMSGERGSACCVPIPNPTKRAILSTNSSNNNNNNNNTTNSSNSNSSDYLLLGISHSKTKFKNKATRDNLPGNVSANHFFSAFYVMDPHEPYTVRARSGRFCLGFSNVNETATATNENDDDKDKNPFARSNMERLRLGGNHYDCPRIHFVSGMAESASDPSRIIIAYGVQDCAPRFIEVEKQQILQLLFPNEHQQHLLLRNQHANDNDNKSDKPRAPERDGAQTSRRRR